MSSVFSRPRLLALMAFTFFLACVVAAFAEDALVLSVETPTGSFAEFDEERLARLNWLEIETHTRWTEGAISFDGPLFHDVLEAAGWTRSDLEGRLLRMSALNDFQVDVPGIDAWAYTPILARRLNGVPMAIRDKGPLWLVYPRDQMTELQNPLIDERWIWQLYKIELAP